jgi:glycine cleavage system H lipoate-binding protein
MFEPIIQDPFATKGAEYLLVIVFLACLVVFWRMLNVSAAPARPSPGRATPGGWFRLAGDRLYHPGHSWVQREQDGTVRVGWNDFAAKLVGNVSRFSLPAPGTPVGQGEAAWRMTAEDGKSVEMLSPVDGTVVEVNSALASSPDVAERDPYGEGWLLKVRPSRLAANKIHLLSGAAARRWMDETLAALVGEGDPVLGVLSQDGGVPVAGMACAIDPGNWDALARAFLLTSEDEPWDRDRGPRVGTRPSSLT